MRNMPKNTFKMGKGLEPKMGIYKWQYYSLIHNPRRTRTKAGCVTDDEGQLHCCQDPAILNLIGVKRPRSLCLVAKPGSDSC